jgi:beta-glucosidase
MLELKRLARIELETGERRNLAFELERSDFAFLELDLKPVIEPGEIEIHIGFSADRSRLRTARFQLA